VVVNLLKIRLAQEVVEFLNHYFERICEAVLAKGGAIDKFIGGAIMVQCGVPLVFSDHALRATRAAVAMRREATGFRTWMQQRFVDWRCRNSISGLAFTRATR
jgi:class 3 adenylate cyclase